MIDIVDGPGGRDDWGLIDWDTDEVYWDETGGRRPLSCSDIVFTRGKYANSLLSEISDTWYLKFIRDKNPDDYFITYAFDKRLKELK